MVGLCDVECLLALPDQLELVVLLRMALIAAWLSDLILILDLSRQLALIHLSPCSIATTSAWKTDATWPSGKLSSAMMVSEQHTAQPAPVPHSILDPSVKSVKSGFSTLSFEIQSRLGVI